MSNLAKDDVIILINRIKKAEDASEEEFLSWISSIEHYLGYSGISDLIFYHKPELTAEEIVEKALSYKPIVLSSSKK